ncbi:MAG: prolyl oligopeptidase family serine peptidase [Verrucomicrobiae bacterium]|nr:prolyl oligopeptidase family serine peptidase [Verrucomicrobiae bacterium]
MRLPVLLCLALALSSSAFAQKRTWTSSDGKSSFEGELLEYNATEIRVKRAADFKTFILSLDKLSEADKTFVTGLLREDSRSSGVKDGPHATLVTGAFVKGTSPEGLNFQFYGNPKWKGEERYPLLIWLHGAGQSGSDNEAQMGGATKPFTEESNQEERPCFVLAPQCPDRNIGWKDSVAANLMTLVKSLCDSLPIDESRLYLTGSSMGGSGSWRIATEHPGIFAAVAPLCGGGDPSKAASLKDTPIWAFHGDKDDEVPLERSTSMIEAIKAAGGTLAQLSILEGEGHLIAGGVYAKPELHEWIFAQRLATPSSP